MEFKIKTLFLIPKNKEKEIRYIHFSPNKVNVITGGSERGKSAIISIIDYCLGSGDCRIPSRLIRRLTEWFGLHITLSNGHEMILARKEPLNLEASGDMFMREGTFLEIPIEINSNCNINEVKHRLNIIANLSYFTNEENEEQKSGFDSRPSFRDYMAFLFQPQYIIANQSTLFYKTDVMAHRQKLINIFKYIMKVVDNNYLENKDELKQIESRLSELGRDIERKQNSLARFRGELKGYYFQSREYGLLNNKYTNNESWTDEDYLHSLEVAIKNVELQNFTTISTDAIDASSKRLSELVSEEITTGTELHNIRHRNELIIKLINGNEDYRNDLLSQHNRLKGVSLFNKILKGKTEQCPLCDSVNDKAKSYVKELIKTNNQIISKGTQLNDNLTVLKAESRKLDKEIRAKVLKLNELRKEADIIKTKNSNDSKEIDLVNSIYKFAGKLEGELNNFSYYLKDKSSEKELLKLESRKREILSSIDESLINDKFEYAKRQLSNIISHYAKIFKAENSEEIISFNEKDLTLRFLSSTGRKDSLFEIGSGSNYMAYHLSTLLAFHEFFLSKIDHPCPNFIIFDQPTQVYFPESDLEISDVNEDKIRVRRIFEVLDEAIIRTKGNLQIIVLEHVGEYAWKDFENIVRLKRWRDDEINIDDRALIPFSWIENNQLEVI